MCEEKTPHKGMPDWYTAHNEERIETWQIGEKTYRLSPVIILRPGERLMLEEFRPPPLFIDYQGRYPRFTFLFIGAEGEPGSITCSGKRIE